jgi:hypothetical protein
MGGLSTTPGRHGGSKGDQPVPWSDVSAPGGIDSESVKLQDPCGAADLQFGLGRTGAWQGMVMQGVVALNTSETSCAMSVPRIEVTTSSGETIPVDTTAITSAVDLAPGESGDIAVGGASPPCGDVLNGSPKDIAHELSVSVGGGTTETRFDDAWMSVACGNPEVIDMTDRVADPTGDPLSQLTGSISAPGEITAGQTVAYTVTITNPTAMDIKLDPCPSYSEGLKGYGDETYLLNCDAQAVIPAESGVDFAMQLTVPEHASGHTYLGWILNVLRGPAPETAVTVE